MCRAFNPHEQVQAVGLISRWQTFRLARHWSVDAQELLHGRVLWIAALSTEIGRDCGGGGPMTDLRGGGRERWCGMGAGWASQSVRYR